MKIKKTKKIRIRLESFNHELLISSYKKVIKILKNTSVTSLSLVTLPTSKRVYCVLRSPHVNKDSREHFEIRSHKRVLDIFYDSQKPIIDVLSDIDLAPGVFYRICLF